MKKRAETTYGRCGSSDSRSRRGTLRTDAAGRVVLVVVYEPFMVRDLTRDDLRRIISAGLKETNGSYKILVQQFNMKPDDYKRFLNFLRKHNCHLPFHQFRIAAARLGPERLAPGTSPDANGAVEWTTASLAHVVRAV